MMNGRSAATPSHRSQLNSFGGVSVRSGFGAEGVYRWELPPQSEAVRAKRAMGQRQFLNKFTRPKKRRIDLLDE